MLVVTRKRNEAIVIGNGVEVQVLRVDRDGVRLGITAPPEVPVHRREIYEMIRRSNAAAAAVADRLGPLAERIQQSLGAK